MPNWSASNSEIQHFLYILPNQHSSYSLDLLWQIFNFIKIDRKTKTVCIFCKSENSIFETAVVIDTYIRKCKKIPLNIQSYLINIQEFQNQQPKNLELLQSLSN
ncbi:28764_t:CDS:1, partial [Dentiscutata erythropus]